MKEYIIYKTLPAPDGGEVDVYLKGNGDMTYDKAEAKVYRVRVWLEILKVIIDILLKFGINSKLKYKRL